MWFISLDTETTGLDPSIHEVLEIKARALTRTLNQIDTFYVKIKPKHLERASEEALKINKYSEESWINALEPLEAYTNFKSWIEKTQIKIPYLNEQKNKDPIGLGQNVSFDIDFIRFNAEKVGVKIPFSYHKLDLVGVSIFMDIARCILPDFQWRKSYSLSKVAPSYGINPGRIHTAEADEETHMKLLRFYIERVRDGWRTDDATEC